MFGFLFNRPAKRALKKFLAGIKTYPVIRLPHPIGLGELSAEDAAENLEAWRAISKTRADIAEAFLADLGIVMTWGSVRQVFESQIAMARVIEPMFIAYAASFKERNDFLVRYDHMFALWSKQSPVSKSFLLDIRFLISERYNEARGGTQYWDYIPWEARGQDPDEAFAEIDLPMLIDPEFRDSNGHYYCRDFARGFSGFFADPLCRADRKLTMGGCYAEYKEYHELEGLLNLEPEWLNYVGPGKPPPIIY